MSAIDQAVESRVEGACQTTWAPNHVELVMGRRTRIPAAVEATWNSARFRANCGLIHDIHHVWVSVDSVLFLWDYTLDNPQVLSLHAESPIITVAGCVPRQGIFEFGYICVVATRVSVSLAQLDLRDRSRADLACNSRLVPLVGFSAPTEGVHYNSISPTPDGRIFLVSDTLHEFGYEREAGWFRPRCWIFKHSPGPWPLFSTSRLRLLETSQLGFIFAVDNLGTLRLYSSRCTKLEELASLTQSDLTAQVLVVAKPLESSTITHLFPGRGVGEVVEVRAVTSAGERLFFRCSKDGAFAFSLQEVTSSRLEAVAQPGEAVDSTNVDPPAALRGSILVEQSDPYAYAAGVWVSTRTPPGSSKAEVDVTTRSDAHAIGSTGIVDLCSSLHLDTTVLDVFHERRFAREGRSFVFLLTNCVQILHVRRKMQASTRSPKTPAECCAYLLQLRGEQPCKWMWHLDDVRVPSFDEQRGCLLFEKSVPPVHLGNWFCGFLFFLGTSLHEVWKAELVVHVPGSSEGAVLGLAIEETLAAELAMQLAAVLAFVRRGLPPSSTSAVPQAAGRSGAYSQLTVGAAALNQAECLLRAIVDVVDRTRQVLGLVSLLHRCKGGALQTALSAVAGRQLSSLVVTPSALEPVVQLCMVLVMDGGRDAQDGNMDLCRDLQELCPAIFCRVDLDRCLQARSSDACPSEESPASNLLRRYVDCVSSSSEDHWVVLARGIQAMALENPQSAVDISLEKIEQLKGDVAAHRIRLLLESLLDGLAGARDNVPVVEALLVRTQLLHADEGSSRAAVPPLHAVILNRLLSNPSLCRILESLLSSRATDVEGFLRERFKDNRVAGECLWKFYSQQDKPSSASAVLVQLAQTSPNSYLEDRVAWLRLAGEQIALAGPRFADAAERIAVMHAVASVQVRVCRELVIIARDGRMADVWRDKAEQSREELQQLKTLEEVHHVVMEFGITHLLFLVLKVAGGQPEPSAVASLWLNLFFPPANSPYSSSVWRNSPQALFPLFTARGSLSFFEDSEQESSGGPDSFRLRVSSLLSELERVVGTGNAMMDIPSAVSVLEYCNCLWLHVHGVSQGTRANRAWVFSVLPLFGITLPAIVVFYAKLVAHLDQWVVELQSMLPTDSQRPLLTVDDVHIHLAEVVVVMLQRWAHQAQDGQLTPQALLEFRTTWLNTSVGLLDGLGLRLNSLQGRYPAARLLLTELLQLLEVGREMCHHAGTDGRHTGDTVLPVPVNATAQQT